MKRLINIITMKKLLIIGTLLVANSLIAQQTPAKDQSKSVLIVGATAHIGDGSIIEKSFIGFENVFFYHIFLNIDPFLMIFERI